MNATNKLFTESKRSEQGDNRSYFVKALNKILDDGLIKVQIQEIGMIWTDERYKDDNGNLKKFNVIIKGYGRIRRVLTV